MMDAGAVSQIVNPSADAHDPSGRPSIIHARGAMAEQVRRFDWESTPLGAIGSWSPTLASFVNLILSSPQPATLMWGERLTLFYNDSAVPTLGELHPQALGRGYREVFADAWPLVGPDIEDCFQRGKTPVRENVCVPLLRNGVVQDNYYTYFLVPVYEGDRIAGVYDPFFDATQQRVDQLEREEAIATQKFLLKLADTHRAASNGREIMQISAELLGRHLNVGRVGYSEAAPDRESMNFETGWAQGELKTLSGSVPMDHWSEDTSTDFSRGRTVVYPDVREEPSLVSELEHYTAIGAISVVAVPFLRRNVWRGSLYVNDSRPRPWTAQEVSLVEEVAHRTTEAVERAQTEEELRALADRLGMAQRSGHMASWEWDLAKNTLVWDGGSEWTYGRPPDEMVHPEVIFTYIHEDDREKVRRDLVPALQGTGEYRSEFRVLWPDGSIHWMLAFGRTVWLANETVSGVVGINIDITEQRLAAEALLRTEKLAAVGRLASSIAHEINNPLESVTNLLYLAKSAPEVSMETQQYLETADRELRRVSTIASQTLRFHKQASGPTICTGQGLLSDTLSIYQGRTVNSRIQVVERYRGGESIDCFEGEVRQVLNNLISNAIDAMPMGGRLFLRSRAATHPKSGKKGLCLTIADTGTGIPFAIKNKVFEAFYSTKGIGGTGLGLWISKDIVDRHHGTLAVRSSQKEGRSGTVFCLFLPVDAVRR